MGLKETLGYIGTVVNNESNGYCLAGNGLESTVLVHSERDGVKGTGTFCTSYK
jgi:hypothetical protein